MIELDNKPVLLAALMGFVLTGCAEVDSRDIRTTGVNATIDVSVGDNQTAVLVDLDTGFGIDADEIVLTQGDRLLATLAGSTKQLVRREQKYFASFNDATPGEIVNVSFERQNDSSARDSNVVLPERLEITAPDADESYNGGESIAIAWSPSVPGQSVYIDFAWRCTTTEGTVSTVRGFSERTPDTGIYRLPVQEVVDPFGGLRVLAPGVPCSVAVSVTRRSFGVLDAAYGQGGSIKANREKRVSVTVIP